MDIPRKSAARKRLIRRIVVAALAATAVTLITIALAWLKPAPPSVERSTFWIDTVKRGPMIRDVHGLGALVPEETLLIPAITDGRVEGILIKPGAFVQPDSVILELSNPELQTSAQSARYALRVAEADYTTLQVTLEKADLDQKATAAQVRTDYYTARLQADRDAKLAKEGLMASLDAQISAIKAKELATRNSIEEKREAISSESVKAQLAAQRVKIEQLRGEYQLKLQQVERLRVKAGTTGVLQALPTPIEVGQNVTAGAALAKVAQPRKLKAELKIPETQAKDVAIGQVASVDTRNGVVEGRVSRIDPAVLNGTVTVDVKLYGPLPQGARPDLSVDGTIQLERLENVVFVGRPVIGQSESTVSLFKLDAGGKYASRVQVRFGRASVNSIEVREGLHVGDQVILSDISNWENYERIRLN